MKSRQFWMASLLLLIIIVIGVGNQLRWWDWRMLIGPITLTHFLVVIGAGYLVIVTPVYSYLKRHTQGFSPKMLALHVFGNLLAFLLITIHYTQQTGRPAEFKAVHSTGLILYIFLVIMVLTGFLSRFRIMRSMMRLWRFIHVSLVLSICIVLVFHVLQYFGIV